MCFVFCRLSDKVEMGLFVARYVSCLLMFGLGLRAPAITTRDYFNISDLPLNIAGPPNRVSCLLSFILYNYCFLFFHILNIKK